MQYEDLTEEQVQAIAHWWIKNDPNEYYFEYNDNFRYAIKGDVDSVNEYERLRERGCCGELDIELTMSDGSVLMYGFNYGH
jgi:hypothetical protein